MLDINFIRANRELVQHSINEKMYKNIDLDKLFALDDQRKSTLQEVESLRKERNQNTESMKGGKPTEEQINRGKILKEKISQLEAKLNDEESSFKNLLKAVPNIIFEDVPLGDESASVEVAKWGEQKAEGVDHLDYATSRDWVDFERGAKVAGAKFYYIKFGIKKVTEHGFTLMDVPDMVNSRVLEGTGFAPRSSDQSDEYYIEGEDLAMIATAEMPITGYHMDEIIDEDKLPLFYAGFSACFRKEAGTYGKHTRGLFRVHQFNKLEMYSFCLPEQSKEIHEKIRAIEEEIWQELGIPYHIINIAAGDLGAPAAKKYDIEYWSPVDQKYRELTSCSNCTDVQAKGLNIRVRRKDGTIETLHTLNGTAISLARTMVAVIENFAEKDGKLKVPAVLKPYLGVDEL